RVQGVTEAFQEGIRVLPVRIARNGSLDENILRLLLGNVRLPRKMEGDLRAQMNANHVGQARLVALYDSYGRSVVEGAIDTIIEHSERIARDIIRKLPDGVYEFQDFLDDAGPGTEPIRVHVAITIAGDGIVVDFSGSSDQVGAALNCYINYTRAYGVFAVRILTDMNVPNNEGSFRPIEVRAREGSFFNVMYPAPSGGRAALRNPIFAAMTCVP